MKDQHTSKFKRTCARTAQSFHENSAYFVLWSRGEASLEMECFISVRTQLKLEPRKSIELQFVLMDLFLKESSKFFQVLAMLLSSRFHALQNQMDHFDWHVKVDLIRSEWVLGAFDRVKCRGHCLLFSDMYAYLCLMRRAVMLLSRLHLYILHYP